MIFGVEQINLNTSEIDKSVQQNASDSEAYAAISRDLNIQAEMMKDYVRELVSLVRQIRFIVPPLGGFTPPEG